MIGLTFWVFRISRILFTKYSVKIYTFPVWTGYGNFHAWIFYSMFIIFI